MESHVNGWPLLEQYLADRSKTQSDLAALLHVTPSAISQLKNGRIQFSAIQLETIVEYFRMSAADAEAFYSSIFNARLLLRYRGNFSVRQERPRREPRLPALPVIACRKLMWFKPALENCSDFAQRHADHFLEALTSGVSVAVRVNDLRRQFRLPMGSLILLDCDRYPVNDQLVFARLYNRTPALYYYRHRDDLTTLRQQEFGSEELSFDDLSPFHFLVWAYPVRSILLDCRRR